jgi:hypothetical protein
MSEISELNLILENRNNVVFADDFLEALGAILAVERHKRSITNL